MRRLPSSGGVEVAVHELGGPPGAPVLLLVHATGFCARTYGPLVEAGLGASFRCWGIDLRGHGETVSPRELDYAWSGFADDVLAVVDGAGPVAAAVGHSGGGAAVLLAEANRPGTFSSLWCYEPIVWPEPEAARLRAERLAEGARRRRATFASKEEAYANFAAKPPFSALAPEALRAYVEHGFDEAMALRCRPDVEAQVYLQAVEGDRFSRLADVGCPVVVAAGGRSDAVTPERAERIVGALPSGRLRVFDELGHFGPLEDPPAVAAAILADLG